jgi:hypothetical protein
MLVNEVREPSRRVVNRSGTIDQMKRSQGGGGAFWRAWTLLLVAAGLGCFAFFLCGLPKEGNEALSRKSAGGSQLQVRCEPAVFVRSAHLSLLQKRKLRIQWYE